jgi:hypothetical protein
VLGADEETHLLANAVYGNVHLMFRDKPFDVQLGAVSWDQAINRWSVEEVAQLKAQWEAFLIVWKDKDTHRHYLGAIPQT